MAKVLSPRRMAHHLRTSDANNRANLSRVVYFVSRLFFFVFAERRAHTPTFRSNVTLIFYVEFDFSSRLLLGDYDTPLSSGTTVRVLVADGARVPPLSSWPICRPLFPSLISQTSDDGGGAAGGPGWGSTVGFLQANSAGWRKVRSCAAKATRSPPARNVGMRAFEGGHG